MVSVAGWIRVLDKLDPLVTQSRRIMGGAFRGAPGYARLSLLVLW